MKQGNHALPPLHISPLGLALLHTLASTLADAQQDFCTTEHPTHGSALVQMHAKDVSPTHHYEHLAGMANFELGHSGSVTTKSPQILTGIKIADEQMESVQDGIDSHYVGISTYRAINKDIVHGTWLKEMNDNQRLFMQLISGLLFGNVVAILSVCVWQVYSQEERKPPTDDHNKEPMNHDLAVAQLLLDTSSIEDSITLTTGPLATSAPGKAISTSSVHGAAAVILSLDNARGRSCSDSLGSGGTPRAPATSKVRRKTEMCRLDKELDNRTITPPLERRGILRTVDAFCTSGRIGWHSTAS